MSRAQHNSDERDLSELSDDELLEEIASMDEDKYPLVKRARRALQEDSS